jgi:hypothetical protein
MELVKGTPCMLTAAADAAKGHECSEETPEGPTTMDKGQVDLEKYCRTYSRHPLTCSLVLESDAEATVAEQLAR